MGRKDGFIEPPVGKVEPGSRDQESAFDQSAFHAL
jgi:hypothetical protein